MAIIGNEIFIVCDNQITVFSLEGKQIRSWGGHGSELGNFSDPWGITIYRNVVFVVDSKNKRIQAFTNGGKFIFEYKHKTSLDMSDIIIDDNYVYINDWGNDQLYKFELIYDWIINNKK